MIAFIASLIQMSYCLRMFERQLAVQSGQDFGLLTNSIWNVFITMTTVGYGDRFPTTTEGRAVAFALMLVGISLMGVITASVAAWFVKMSQNEK